jgi:hypothetical protein
MELTTMEFKELIAMRHNIREKVGLLELCWSCQKVSECQQWLINESIPVWLCGKCVEEVSYRMTEGSGMPLSVTAAEGS